MGGHMYIKKVLNYSYNYADYIVSDGKNELVCMCLSVPLHNGKEPKSGMKITNIEVFSIDGLKISKITNPKYQNYNIKKYLFNFFKCKLKGKIIDSKLAIVKVYDFIISLGWEYPEGFSEDFKEGDFIEFIADRLDCEIS